jgi:hypothetical protein
MPTEILKLKGHVPITSSMLVRYATANAAATEAELSMATTSLLFIGIVDCWLTIDIDPSDYHDTFRVRVGYIGLRVKHQLLAD